MKGGRKMVKKILVFLTVLGVLLGFSGFLSAYSTSTSLGIKGTGSASISTAWSNSPTHSALLSAPFDNANGPEGRVRITFNEVVTLNDIVSFSWMQNVVNGYVSHVDVLLDVNNNGVYDGTAGGDDALVFEYAKVAPLDCDDVADYPTGVVNTFGDKGIVDGGTYAWLASGPPGPCGDLGVFDANHNSLTEWKSTYGSTRVIAFEIEVDGWILESQAYVDDIMINGALVENFEGGEQIVEVGVVADLSFIATPNPLNFGNSLVPGQTSIQEVTLIPGTSNLDISVAITGASFIVDMMADREVENAYVVYNGDSFMMTANTPIDFNTKVTVPIGLSTGSYSGTITYTVFEHV